MNAIPPSLKQIVDKLTIPEKFYRIAPYLRCGEIVGHTPNMEKVSYLYTIQLQFYVVKLPNSS